VHQRRGRGTAPGQDRGQGALAGDDLDAVDQRGVLVYQLPIRGTVGTLALAKRAGEVAAIRPVLEDLRRAGMCLSDSLVERVCGEPRA